MMNYGKEIRVPPCVNGGFLYSGINSGMNRLEKEMLFDNLKEYMLRTSVIFALKDEKKIDLEEAYDKLYKLWDEYFESARMIFRTKDENK